MVTVEPRFYESATDSENECLVPESLNVIRTPAVDVLLARRFGVGDIGMRSLWHHWKESCRLCSSQQVDLVFISVPPYAPMVLGRLLHSRFGLPYVIDYQDPWVTDYYWRLPRKQRPPKWPVAYALSRILEPFALRHASGLVGVSKGTTDRVTERYDWSQRIPTAEIPLGGEPADFEYLTQHPRSHGIFDPHDGMRHISYVGACIAPMYPAVQAILRAVRTGLERSPRLFSKLRLHFVGSSYAPPGSQVEATVVKMAHEHGISHLVEECPARVPYLDSLQLLLDSDALLLIGSEEPHYTASKVFPYILAGRPIIAVMHKASSVVEILKSTGAASLVTFDGEHPPLLSVEILSRYLEDVLASRTEIARRLPYEAFKNHTTRAMAELLAAFFDNVTQPSRLPQGAFA